MTPDDIATRQGHERASALQIKSLRRLFESGELREGIRAKLVHYLRRGH